MTSLDEIINGVATILAVSVLIDERERDQELIEFVHAVTTINQRIRPGVILPRKTILEWYDRHKDDIAEKLASERSDIWKTEILEAIKDPELRRLTLAAIFAISICDYRLDDEECDFLKLAVKMWDTHLPRMDDMELMAG